jgi:hypothetical protein
MGLVCFCHVQLGPAHSSSSRSRSAGPSGDAFHLNSSSRARAALPAAAPGAPGVDICHAVSGARSSAAHAACPSQSRWVSPLQVCCSECVHVTSCVGLPCCWPPPPPLCSAPRTRQQPCSGDSSCCSVSGYAGGPTTAIMYSVLHAACM